METTQSNTGHLPAPFVFFLTVSRGGGLVKEKRKEERRLTPLFYFLLKQKIKTSVRLHSLIFFSFFESTAQFDYS